MKTLQSFTNAVSRHGLLSTVTGSGLLACIALGCWLAVAPASNAQAQCTVCHKNTTTLTFACNSLDYRRHKDHGDPDGACNVTPTGNQ